MVAIYQVGIADATTRAASFTSGDVANSHFRGVLVSLDVTSAPGAQTLQVVIEGKDYNGPYYTLLQGATLSAAGQYRYLVYPGAGAASGGITATISFPLSAIWRVRIVHSGAGNWTYSVSATLLP